MLCHAERHTNRLLGGMTHGVSSHRADEICEVGHRGEMQDCGDLVCTGESWSRCGAGLLESIDSL